MTRFLITLGFVAIALAQSQEPPSASGPEIILDRTSPDIFPESWRTPKINAKAGLLAETEHERCREIVSRALGKYPAGLLEATLKKVYCLGRLEYSGVAAGGTRSRSAIYVVCKPAYSATDVEGILHAEYSSILFQKFAKHFDREAWQRLNPPDFSYLGGGARAVRAGQASRRFDSSLHEQGFIHEYAQASIEEDFNSHAARLFKGEAKYWEAVERHPKLQAKAGLVMDFYAVLRVSTDQPLGDLAIALLEPEHLDSLATWGFVPEILHRTEYIEGYVIAPLAERMMKDDPKLKAGFEAKLAADPEFAKDPDARLQWFYERSPFYDSEYLRYPVGIER